jgi:hypothetical protein
MHQKRDFNARDLMTGYNFKKIFEKKEKKTFAIIHMLLNFD